MRSILLAGAFTLCLCGSLAAQDNETEYPESVADCASMRVPCETMRGVTNHRFQWTPGYLDVPLYLIQKYKIRERAAAFWREHAAFIEKYLPSVIKYAMNWNAEKNYIITVVPGVLKVLKKW